MSYSNSFKQVAALALGTSLLVGPAAAAQKRAESICARAAQTIDAILRKAPSAKACVDKFKNGEPSIGVAVCLESRAQMPTGAADEVVRILGIDRDCTK